MSDPRTRDGQQSTGLGLLACHVHLKGAHSDAGWLALRSATVR